MMPYEGIRNTAARPNYHALSVTYKRNNAPGIYSRGFIGQALQSAH